MAKTAKSRSIEGPVVDPELINAARDYVFNTKPLRQVPCRICGSPGATDRSDKLCWICRHLKISAWRESEAQDSASE